MDGPFTDAFLGCPTQILRDSLPLPHHSVSRYKINYMKNERKNHILLRLIAFAISLQYLCKKAIHCVKPGMGYSFIVSLYQGWATLIHGPYLRGGSFYIQRSYIRGGLLLYMLLASGMGYSNTWPLRQGWATFIQGPYILRERETPGKWQKDL